MHMYMYMYMYTYCRLFKGLVPAHCRFAMLSRPLASFHHPLDKCGFGFRLCRNLGNMMDVYGCTIYSTFHSH